jgi:restriction system protein
VTAPTRPLRPRRAARGRRFDLRATAFFFAFLALLLSLGGLLVRTAADVAEHRPAWAVAVVLTAVAVVVACRRGRRRWSARRLVRHATEALEEAAETAADALDTAPPGAGVDPHARDAGVDPHVRVGAPAGPLDEGASAATVAIEVPPVLDETLDPAAFEQAVADLCARDGCTDVEVVGGAGDLGADVLALTPDGRRVVIQCKRYAVGHRVGSQDLQRFGGTCFTVHAADVAVLVTTSDFTAPAAEYAEQCGIVCVDGERLAAWEAGTGPVPWEPRRAEGEPQAGGPPAAPCREYP